MNWYVLYAVNKCINKCPFWSPVEQNDPKAHWRSTEWQIISCDSVMFGKPNHFHCSLNNQRAEILLSSSHMIRIFSLVVNTVDLFYFVSRSYQMHTLNNAQADDVPACANQQTPRTITSFYYIFANKRAWWCCCCCFI